MTELKCPFCQQELEIGGVDGILRGCPKCRNLGTETLWQELIRTRKALNIAVDALDRMAIHDSIYDIIARNAIKRIKEFEQKD